MINFCIDNKTFPDCLKIASVLPVYKKGDVNDKNNYRPISLLPILSKVFEKLLLGQILHFLEINNILSPHQFGFRKAYSITTAVTNLLHKIIDCFEHKQLVIF